MEFANNQKFKNAVHKLYGAHADASAQAARYEKIYRLHKESVPSAEVLFFSSPGRIEICGNHTDHNNGKVLCAAINVDTIACVSKTDDSVITVNSVGYSPVRIDIRSLQKVKAEEGSSEGLVRGVCDYFVKNGYKVGGFTATTVSDVFKGAGVSSSASFEVLICEILNQLYNEGMIDKVFKAKASQYAENVFFGKPCGLLDQSAIALGGVSYIDFKNVKNPKIESMDWRFDCDIVLVNGGGDHSDLTADYAAIRLEMEEVARVFGKKNLRAVPKKKFLEELPRVAANTSGRSTLRALHYFDENDRVEKCKKAIVKPSFKTFCATVNASGESSYDLLQNVFTPGDRAQGIALAIAIGKLQKGMKAVKVHGGGFMGTAIFYLEHAHTAAFSAVMRSVFGDENVFVVNVRGDGTCRVDL